MAKGSRPDKQNMVMGMFAKIARDADRQERKRIKDAKRNGEFYRVPHPELLSLKDQFIYFKALKEYESGSDTWDVVYNRKDEKFPFPYKFAKQ